MGDELRAPHMPHIQCASDKNRLQQYQAEQHATVLTLVHQKAKYQRRKRLADIEPRINHTVYPSRRVLSV